MSWEFFPFFSRYLCNLQKHRIYSTQKFLLSVNKYCLKNQLWFILLLPSSVPQKWCYLTVWATQRAGFFSCGATVYLQLHYNENESVCESVRERRANFLLQQFKNGISWPVLSRHTSRITSLVLSINSFYSYPVQGCRSAGAYHSYHRWESGITPDRSPVCGLTQRST